MVILSALIIFFGVFPRYILEVIGEIQSSIGITPIQLEGNAIQAINGLLNSYHVFVIFGFGFLISLAIFMLLQKSRKVGLMDTFTSAEFIHTPELYHYSHDFYAPFERLYKNHPSVENFLVNIANKFDELGQMVNALFFSHKPSITVFWITVVTAIIYLGGARI